MQGTEDIAGLSQVLLIVHLGQTEVGHPHHPLCVQQQIRRLDVAVIDPLLVGVLEASATCAPMEATLCQ